jgi:NADH:ubiquinone reductase (H+-translocating)
VLPPMGPKLGLIAQRRLEKMDVEVQLNAMVSAVDYQGITIKEKDGGERRIECACKVWAAGVQASSLGKIIAEQSDGTEVDRAGRVVVEPDLTVKGHRNVFIIGDLMSVPGVPGMAQGAIQGATYATKAIKRELKGQDDPNNRKPFKYFDKGSMATVSRFNAVAQVGKLEFGGFIAWLAWLVLHLFYLVGHRNRIAAVFAWLISFLGRSRGQMAITSQMIYARVAMKLVQEKAEEGALAAAERAEQAEKQAEKQAG